MKPPLAKELAGHAFWTKVRRLDLIMQRLTAKAIGEIFARPRFDALTWLSVSSNPIGDKGVATIASTPLPSLRELLVRQVKLTTAAIGAIARMPALRELQIQDDPVGDAGARALPKQLTRLYASGCQITDVGAAAIAELPALVEVDLTQNDGIGDEGARAIARSKSLRRVRLAWDKIGDAGAKALLEMPKLESLELFGCKLSPKMAKAVKARFGENAC
jgi:hypothetical protein